MINLGFSQNQLSFRCMLELSSRRPERFKGFSARSGRKIKSQAWERLWALYGVDCTAQAISAVALKSELAVEIGFGNGANIVNQAMSNPHITFIGIELYKAGVYSLLRQIEQAKLENVRVFFGQALHLLPRLIDQSLRKVEIFSPDPWPKRKQQKRRLINQEFIDLIFKKLIPGGTLHVATDCLEYGQTVLCLLERHNSFINLYPGLKYAPREQIARVTTKFEARALEKGEKILDLMFLSKQ